MKKILIIIFLIVFLTACTAESITNDIVPIAEENTTQSASKEVLILSYPNSDFTNIIRVTYEITRNDNIPTALSVANSLLSGMGNADVYVPFGGKSEINSFQISRNLAVIDIDGNFSDIEDKELFCSVVSLTNSLTELNDIEYVKLTINGVGFAQNGVFDSPLAHFNEDLYLLYLEHLDILANGAKNVSVNDSNILLYFMDLSGQYLLTEVRTSYQNSSNTALNIFNELKNGPASAGEMQCAIPKNVILQGEPETHYDETYGQILTLSLEAPKHETIDSEAKYMLAASIVLSMQNAMPEIDGVRILINSQPALGMSVMKCEDFNNMLGNIVTLYFASNEKTQLVPVKRALSQSDYQQPLSRLKELMRGLLDNDTDSAISVFPSTITEQDILSATVQGNIIYVDFSQNFLDSIDKDYSSQRMLIYSVVNTLTEFSYIKKVQFLIDGEFVTTLGGQISTSSPLLPNPGIIQN